MSKPREEFTKDGMRRVVSISLHPDQQDALDEMAVEKRSNRSIIIREAIDMYLRVNGRDPRQQARDTAVA
jgi:predicted transcriptional regulator